MINFFVKFWLDLVFKYLAAIRECSDSVRKNVHYTENNETYTVSKYFEKELIETAASTVAALVEYRMFLGDDQETAVKYIYEKIAAENARQVGIFGPLPRNNSWPVWIVIIAEDLAEAAAEIDYKYARTS